MRVLPEINIHKLPEDVHSKLAQLELEYSEGDLTEKGYEKKRRLLLAPYVRSKSNGAAQQKNKRERDKGKRRLTRNESRYHSEIRTEAVQQALAEWNRSDNVKENGQERPEDNIIIRTNRRRQTGSTSALVTDVAKDVLVVSVGGEDSTTGGMREKTIVDLSRMDRNVAYVSYYSSSSDDEDDEVVNQVKIIGTSNGAVASISSVVTSNGRTVNEINSSAAAKSAFKYCNGLAENKGEWNKLGGNEPTQKEKNGKPAVIGNKADVRSPISSPFKKPQNDLNNKQQQQSGKVDVVDPAPINKIILPEALNGGSSSSKPSTQKTDSRKAMPSNGSPTKKATCTVSPVPTTSTTTMSAETTIASPKPAMKSGPASESVKVALRIKDTSKASSKTTNGSSAKQAGSSVRTPQVSMRRGSHQQISSSHHHQMPIKRTSVLVLEDRPLPELPPDASDLSDANEEEDEDVELRRMHPPNARGAAGGGPTDDAVYINTRTSTNDSGLGGSTRAPQEYANANFPLKPTRVSQKIQQLLLTLQRPKRRPIQEFYNDDDDAELEAMAKIVDPNAPKPTGSLITPIRGDFPPSASTATAQQQLPRSVDAILQRHVTAQPKGVAGVVLDCSGKPSATLTYGKLLTRATKIAHMLLSRQVTIVTSGVKEKIHLCLPGDRVALVYPNTEPLAFLAAFYGCLLAGVVPVPIEVPLTKRDAGIQQFGFLLGSCGVHVALTTETCLKGLPKVGSHHQSTTSGASGAAVSPHSGAGNATHHHHTFPSSTTGSGGSGGAASTSGAITGNGGGASSTGVNYYNHYAASTNPNDVADFKGWPRLHWTVTEHLSRPPKDWQPPATIANDECAYIEHTSDGDGTVKGVCVSRQAMLNHCRALTAVMGYREADTMVCVLDFKRDVGLWHAVLAAIYAGMRIYFIPYSLMKINPTAWLQQCTRQQATVALVKSRDLHWSLMTVARDVAAATSKEPPLKLSALRAVVVADGANPWSLSSCDQFLTAFHTYGLHPEALCPCTGSPETGTVSIRRPPSLSGESGRNVAEIVNGNETTAAGPSSASSAATATQSRMGRGILSMLALSHSVVRVDQENSLTSLTLQDAGQVIAGGMAIVVKPSCHTAGAGSVGSGGTCTGAKLCKMDEVGEICLHAPSTASSYFGLRGVSQQHFAVTPLAPDDRPLGPAQYVRSGLIGFLGPNGLIFVIGNKTSMLAVSGRQHSADDLIATVLAVEPMRFVYRGRIAVFSVRVLRDERICIVAEQKPDISEEDAFNWMYRVRQAVDSIHQVGVYCMALLMPNQLPKTPLGGIHVTETRRRFLDGCLYPTTVMMSPQSCVFNLPKPREPRLLDVGAAAMFVGNIVQGARIAGASGRELNIAADEAINLIDILRQRAAQTPDHVLYTLMNAKGTETDSLSCQQLLKKAERIGALLLDKGRLSAGDHVALIFAPGLELISAFYGCLSVGLVPVCIRAPSASNLQASLITVRMVVDVSKSVALLSNSAMIKLLKSKEASSHRLNTKAWPTILDIDDAPSSSVARRQRNAAGVSALGGNGSVGSADRHSSMRNPTATCYLDFSVSTTGQLAGVVVTEYGAAMQCKSLKVACELYPSRNVTLCLDPYSGLGFALWCLSSIYSGHHSTLIAPSDVEQNPANLLTIISQNKVRDAFCSYSVMEMCVRELAPQVQQLREKTVNLSCLRTWVAVAEERPRVQLCNAFVKLLAPLGLAARAVSTSFGARINAAICMQGAASPDPSILYVDARALRNDRVSLVEKGAPHSIPLMESGKLLPGVKVVIANPDTGGQCADSHLGEIWVASGHNAAGYFSLFGEEAHLHTDHFNARLNTGDTKTVFARTGYLGFLRQTQSITADGAFHDAVFVVGALDEALMLRGMRYHPADVETTVMRAHRRIIESAVFTWMHLLVAVAETDAPEAEAADLVPAITSAILEEHHLIVGVVLVVDPATIPINSRGEKQRMHLRDAFLKDQLDPIYVAYNE